MMIGMAFDFVGHLLCIIPYALFWDYTDEKHAKVIKILEERERLANEGASEEEIYAVGKDEKL